MNSHTKTYEDFFNTDNIMLERMSTLILDKSKSNKGYKNQIEQKLLYLAENCQSEVPKKEYRYEIVQEYSDVAIARMSDDGDIVVNKGEK